MFEGLKNMAGLAGMMKDLPRIKQKLEEVRANLGRIEVYSETGGGAVKAVVNCKMRLVSLHIDRAMMTGLIDSTSDQDRALAEELITGAVNAALERAQERATHELQQAAQELGLPLPPGGLGGLM